MNAALGWRIFLRSLLVQASWSFARMQSLGFFLMTAPALARFRLAPTERTREGLRRLRDFNTHPYLAGLVAATVIREEELGAAETSVDNLKNSLMCVLGAIGDEFFWGTLRPLAALAALPAALAGKSWAPVAMLAIYNVPHLWIRALGIGLGLSKGRDIVALLQSRPLARLLPALGAAIAGLAGLLVGLGAGAPAGELWPAGGWYSTVASIGLFTALLTLAIKGLSQERLLAGAAALAVLAALLRVAVAS